MGKHYSNLMKAARYQAALNAYVEFVTGKTSRQPNVGNGRKRQPSQTLYITPFSFPLGASDRVQVSANQTAWSEYEAAFEPHTITALPAGGSGIKLRGFKPARVNIVSGRSADGVVKQSHITKQSYLSYGGTSRSIPFGRAAAGDTEGAVFAAIKGAIAPVGTALKVYLQPEAA